MKATTTAAMVGDSPTEDVGVHQQPKKRWGKFPVAQSVLTIHTLYDLPVEMQQFSSQRERFEIVVKVTVKYNYRGRRIAHMQLAESVIHFSPASILFKGGHFVLDLDNPEVVNNMSRSGTVPSSSANGFSEQCCSLPVDEEDFDVENEQQKVLVGNSILLQYPFPAGLSTHIDVAVGIRQRRLDSSVVRWISSSLNTPTPSDGAGFFSVSAEEVSWKKTVTRVVGLCVGGVVCSVSVNPNDERESVMERLMQDKKRFSAKYGADALGTLDILEMLRNGSSEQEIHRHMQLLVDPEYYARRLQNLLALYPTSAPAEWRRGWQLLCEYATREEELMRRAIIEVGPECSTVFPRHRLLAFRKKYALNEESILSCLEPVLGDNISKRMEVDPDAIFAVLTKEFGREPRPTSYLFPAQLYTPDRRTFFFEALQLPGNWSSEKCREMALISRNRRIPFMLSPCERPLHIGRPGKRIDKPLSEIEILRAKYAPEFVQIVPSIADALQVVVEQNRRLPDSPLLENSFAIFYQEGLQPQLALQNFVHRTAEYTFISPASLLGAIIYLDRLCMRHAGLIITERNVLRLFLTSVRVASKILELRSINNRHFANVFGLDTKAMNLLEEVFIKRLQFDLFLSPEEFGEYAQRLQPSNAHQFCTPPNQRSCSQAKAMVSDSLPVVDGRTRQMLSSKLTVGKKISNDAAVANSNDRRASISTRSVGGKAGGAHDPPNTLERGTRSGNVSGNGVIRCLPVTSDPGAPKSEERNTVNEASTRHQFCDTSCSNSNSAKTKTNDRNNDVAFKGIGAEDGAGDACRVIVVGCNQNGRKPKLVT